MGIIEFIQRASNPILDWFMRIITEGGDVTFAIIVGAILFWLIDKKFAYKMMLTFLFSAGINSTLKGLFNKPRPFHKDPSLDIMKLDTVGSSFPSGHSQNIAVMATMVPYQYKSKLWIKITAIVLLVLVPFSRLYLGQHFLEDILVGVVLGIGIGIFALFILTKFDDYEDYIGLGLIPVFIALMFIFKDDNQVYVAGGALTGLSIGYFIEKRYIKYEVKAPLKIQIFKLLIGLSVALGLRTGLKLLFNLISKENNILDAVRYLIIALWASLGAMALFKKIFPQKEVEQIIIEEEITIS